jgi:hypothetical protein
VHVPPTTSTPEKVIRCRCTFLFLSFFLCRDLNYNKGVVFLKVKKPFLRRQINGMQEQGMGRAALKTGPIFI